MGLSNDLLSQFAKETANKKKIETETTVYGTVVEFEGNNYVRLDGSDMLTPYSSTVEAKPGERVAILIKNHSAIVTGNISSPGARVATVEEIEGKTKIYVDTISGENLDYVNGKFQNLEAKDAEFVKLHAENAKFHSTVTDELAAVNATIKNLNVDNLDAKYANIDFANIGEAAFKKIFSDSGMIKDLVVGDHTVTGEFVGVTISGDLIKANTVKADKIVVKGSDGLYYKLNVTEGGIAPSETVTEEDLQNGLHGSNIIAHTITAEKVSVNDLVAFDATIGGFNITDSAIYSGVKESVDNTTRGIYLDKDGQMVLGDSNNYLKYFRDADGTYKLQIAAGSIVLGSSGKNVETALGDLQTDIDGIQIGGRNLLLDSKFTKVEGDGTNVIAADGELIFYSDTTDNTYSIILDCSNHAAAVLNTTPITLSVEYYIDEEITLAGATSKVGFAVYKRNIYGVSTGMYSCDIFDPATSLTYSPTGKWQKRSVTVTTNNRIPEYVNAYFLFNYASGKIRFRNPKVEIGTKATDWTLAPEDVDDSIDKAQATANNASTNIDNNTKRIEDAESAIIKLDAIIAQLVTDENGMSLMTQTADGWTFNMSSVQKSLSDISSTLDTVQKSGADTESIIDALEQSVDDLGEYAEYIRIIRLNDGTGNVEPCIELGESDSNFKVRITNTKIMFMEGPNIKTYIDTYGLVTESERIEKELVISGNVRVIDEGNDEYYAKYGYVWKVRPNGNLGLSWKGAIN